MINSRNNYQRGNIGNYNYNSLSNNNCGCNSCELKKKLQMIDFAMVDTALYLNAYPECQKALEYYNQLRKERKAIEDSMGHTLSRVNSDGTKWEWVHGPWPWELDAN